MTNPPHAADMLAACQDLATRDAALAAAFLTVGVPAWRHAPAAFVTLARIVTFQLISTRAAEAIWQRLETRLSGEVTARRLRELGAAELRACGQSGPKVAHLLAIAEAELSGALDFAQLQAAGPQAARAALLAIRGVGPWTAEVFLLSGLGYRDAFPAGDVGLMEAYRQLAGAESRLSAKAFAAKAEAWRPHRGVAAHLLWGWLNLQRQQAGSGGTGQARTLS